MAQVLRHLKLDRHPDLLVGTETMDDAGVYRISDDLALVQTVDFFPPLVNDAYAFGRIAAANALSDVYAMGGQPLTALNIVGFPDKELPYEMLGDILRGGSDVAREAGCTIVGGHSVRDAEVKYGMAVTGRVHPQRIWTNAGARPGDVLVLTKPIGGGTLCTAVKNGKLPEEALAEAISVMATLNRSAAEAAAGTPVHACTDITGFGLVGHVFEMADGGDVTIELVAGSVPLLPRALDLARGGVLTRAAAGTQRHLGARLDVSAGVEEALAGLLMDAQTSGGLLFAVPEEQSAALLAELRRRGTPCAARVGRVLPGSAVRVRLVP